MEHEVIIYNGISKSSTKQHFDPPFTEIMINDTIRWTNRDTESHNIVSGEASTAKPDYIFSTGVIEPGKDLTFEFKHFFTYIPYFCVIHPQERGIITMTLKDSHDMTFRETKEYFHKVFEFKDTDGIPIGPNVGPYLDPAILSEIIETADPVMYSRKVAIVFWDISRFSLLSENLKMAPHLIMGFLSEYFSLAIKIIHNHNGIVDKFIGGGIMAFFGKNYDDDGIKGSIDAINAAIELRKSFDTLKLRWISIWKTQIEYPTIIDLKCGINTGDVLMGEITTEGRKQFSLFGSTVNLASRLEGEGDNDQIIISHYTYGLINSIFETTIKKITNKIKAFEYITEYYEITNNNSITALFT